MEHAVRFTSKPENCKIHGLRYASFDLLAGKWLCLGTGSHWPTADPKLTEAMKRDFRRLGIPIPDDDMEVDNEDEETG